MAFSETYSRREQKRCHTPGSMLSRWICGLDCCSTTSMNSSLLLLSRPRQIMRALATRSRARSRAYSAGSSLRIARSPVPPNKTKSKSEIAIAGLSRSLLVERGVVIGFVGAGQLSPAPVWPARSVHWSSNRGVPGPAGLPALTESSWLTPCLVPHPTGRSC